MGCGFLNNFKFQPDCEEDADEATGAESSSDEGEDAGPESSNDETDQEAPM